MNDAFLRDPLTFRHWFEGFGCRSFADFVRKRYLSDRPSPEAVSLMCGDGWQDRKFLAEGLFERGYGIDQDDQLIRLANASKGELSLTYRALAPGFELAQPGTISVIYSYGRLAYSNDLNATLDLARDLLKQGGMFAFFGYCGARSGPSAQERDIILRIVKALPPLLRDGVAALDDYYVRTVFADASHLTGNCERVQGAIQDRFRDIEVFEMGGMLSFPIWHLTRGRLSYDQEKDHAVLLVVQAMEQRLLHYKILGSGMKLIVGKK